MSSDEKSLPRPPKTPFGRQRAGQEQIAQELLSDRMAEAAAHGRLDEFLQRELPDSEHARALAQMMIGMTGMMPTAAPAQATPSEPQMADQVPPAVVPEDVQRAIQAGDVKGLMDMLQREHQKRAAGGETSPDVRTQETAEPPAPPEEKAIADALVRIAAENRVTVDWVVMRAMKLYVEEYRKTGRL